MTTTAGAAVLAARSIAPMIELGADDGERLGRLPDATAGALLDRRLFSVLVPSALGGHGEGHTALFEVIETISHADAAAGWCVSIGTTNNTGMAEGLPPEGLAEVFGPCDGRVVAAGALIPTAQSGPVEGGFRVSGRWAWASGNHHCDWYVVGALITTDAGGLAIRMHVVRRTECEIVDNWHVMGLKATGSCDVVVADVFVPTHRCYLIEFDRADSFAVSYAANSGAVAGASDTTTNRRHGATVAEMTAFGVAGLAAFSAGVARRALDELAELAPKTRRMLADGFLAEDNAVQIAFAQVDGPLRAARLAALTALERADVELESGGLTEQTRIEIHEAALTLTRAARQAVLFAYDAAPAAVVYLSHPIQRCLRDLLTGLKHAAGSPAMFSKLGRARLGITDHGL